MNHGTITCYTHNKCRCDACKAAKRESTQRYWLKRGRGPLGNPCQLPDGRIFPSQAAAGRALGVCRSTISAHLERNGDLSQLGKRNPGRNGGAKKPIAVGNRTWASRADLARYLGRPDYCVRDWLKRDRIDLLIAALMLADAKAANVRIAA